MQVQYFIVGKKIYCGSLETLKFCKLKFLTLSTQKVVGLNDLMRQIRHSFYHSGI